MRGRRLLSAPVWDSVLAGFLAVVLVAYAWAGETTTGRKAAGTVVSLVLAACIRWRRRYPVAAAVGIAGLVALFEILGREAGTILIVPYLIAFYSVGAYAELRRAVVGFVLTYGATVAGLFADPTVKNVPENALFVAIVAVGAWTGGVLVRVNRSRSAKLVELASQLEQERDEKARLAVAAERGRIARELHDVVAHGISVIAVQAGAGRHALADDPQRAHAAFAAIERAARGALVEMRHMLGLLRDRAESASPAPLPGLGDIDALIAQAHDAGIAVDRTIDGEPSQLPVGVDLAAYRVLQEALTNVRKHAPDARVSIVVRYTASAVEIEVTDDGESAPRPITAQPSSGYGLIGMRERVALYGGRLEVGPRRDRGFAVKATIPVDQERV